MGRLAVRRMVSAIQRSNGAATSAEKGRALEDFVCAIFQNVAGIEIIERNILNAFETEELDVVVWNAQPRTGLHFLPSLILIECKNWSFPVGSQEISYFAARLRQRNCDHGMLVAANGVTGVAADITAAHFQLATALASGIRILVFTLDELRVLATTKQFCAAFKRKLCQLVVTGTLPPGDTAV
jgi:hypothetical protein